jgi:Fe2+ or Zn2+ uptake regulation protein
VRRVAGSRPGRPRATGRRRTTRQVDATLRALAASFAHPTAEQVLDAVRRELPSIGRGTVYRNLSKLVTDGNARIVHGNGRAARFDARLDVHDHFVCTRCTLVADVERCFERQPRARARVAGHRVESRTLTYFGVCRTGEGGARAAAPDAGAASRG